MTDEDHYRGEVTQKAVVFGPEGNVLLVRSEGFPWELAGGRIEKAEDPAPALARELREELGLDVTVERPVKTVTGVWYNRDEEPVYAVVYHCEADRRAVDLHHEHDEFEWVPVEEALDRMPVESLEVAVERAHADRMNEKT